MNRKIFTYQNLFLMLSVVLMISSASAQSVYELSGDLSIDEMTEVLKTVQTRPDPDFTSPREPFNEPFIGAPAFPGQRSPGGNSRQSPTSTIEVRNRSFDGEPVTLDVLDLKNIDILDVLKLISQKSGINIIANQNVTGRVTVFLRDIGVEDALRIIVEAYGWAFAKDEDIIKVMTAADYEARYGVKFGQQQETQIRQLAYAKTPDMMAVLNQMKSTTGKVIPDEKSGTLILVDNPDKVDEMMAIITRLDVPMQTEVFQLSYAKAEEISGKVSEVLTPGVGTAKYDERTNRLVVRDISQKIKEVEQLVVAFDRKDREVLIEAKILRIALTDEYKLGVDWQAVVSDFDSLTLTSDFNVLTTDDAGKGKGELSVGTLSNDDYSLVVEALDAVGETEIISSPRIMAVNNQEAKILVGRSEPYVTSTTTTPASGAATTAESVNFIEVGVKLFVTPRIHEDDFITMRIKPEISSTLEPVVTGIGNSIPVVDTSEAETTVMVKNGVTIVIGGLIEDEASKQIRKVPVLGDIPLLGAAFRNISDSVSKTEIAIFLTPTIVTGDIEDDISFGKLF